MASIKADGLMTERPILFSGPMVRAILEGRKTMTRRVMKLQPVWREAPNDDYATWYPAGYDDCKSQFYESMASFQHSVAHDFSPYFPGTYLWVRETFAANIPGCESQGGFSYRADHIHPCGDGPTRIKWRPSIFMPRSVSRITLEITGVRTERLGHISEKDAIAEGMFYDGEYYGEGPRRCTARSAFMDTWDSVNGKRPGYGWNDNPWVWVVEFKRV